MSFINQPERLTEVVVKLQNYVFGHDDDDPHGEMGVIYGYRQLITQLKILSVGITPKRISAIIEGFNPNEINSIEEVFDVRATIETILPDILHAIDEYTFPFKSDHSLEPASKPQYSLTKGLDSWKLIFDKQETVLKNDKGLLYIDYLLHNPNKDPIKAIELNSLISKIDCKNGKYYEQSDEYGNLSVIDKNSVVSEGNLDSEERKVGIQLWKKRRSLESELECQNLNEIEKNEIQEELKKIQKTLDGQLAQISSNYQKVTKAVQAAIRRLQDNLSKSTTSDNRTPHQILRNFSQHIETYILNPSSRFKGSYVYTPPNGINWE